MNRLNQKSLEHVYGMLNAGSQHQLRLVSKMFSQQFQTGFAFRKRLMFLLHRLSTDQLILPGEERYIIITLLVRKPSMTHSWYSRSSVRHRQPMRFKLERNMLTGTWSRAFLDEKGLQPRKTDPFFKRRRRRHGQRRVKAPKIHTPPYSSESDPQFLTMVVHRSFEFKNADLATATDKTMKVFKVWGAEEIQAFKKLPHMLPYSDPSYHRADWGAEGVRSMHWQTEGNANTMRMLRNHNIFDDRPQVVWSDQALNAARARLGAAVNVPSTNGYHLRSLNL